MISSLLSVWARGVFTAMGVPADTLLKIDVVPTARPEFGDYQCNASMTVAKLLKRAPREIAEQFAANADAHEAIDKIEVAGPGFLNFYLKDAWLVERICDVAARQDLGIPQTGAGRRLVMDYSGPNVAKPMHIGHIRSTIIGNALDRIHRSLGYDVISDNHMGDWGTQFGILIMGYRNFLDMSALEASPVEELERVYVRSYERSREDEGWMSQCRQELVKLQAGDDENFRIWSSFVQLSLKEFSKIFDRLGVRFDLNRGESYYNDRLKQVVDRLIQEGIAHESEGATVVSLDEEKLPVCIVRKSDGAFNYATTDLATILTREQEFEPEKIVYVTDERQQNHFSQIFAIAGRLGVRTSLNHVWFGLMRLPEGTFSTRQGNVIKLEKLLDEAETRALAIVKEASPDMPEPTQKEVARKVGIGAVKYADLSQNPQTMIVFTWDKALALEGNSAPYLQYACARICSVRDKYAAQYPGKNPDSYPLKVVDPIERTLILKANRFGEAVFNAANHFRPNYLAEYLYDLSQSYSSFYQNLPFLKAEEGLRESRVRLCGIIASILTKGLDLLGIETPERI